MRKVIAVILCCFMAGCSNNRGGFIDEALDSALYRADTKAERLLRYFEIQALLVQFAAYTAAGSDRKNIATDNAESSKALLPLISCLYYGSLVDAPTVDQAIPKDRPVSFKENDPVRSGYCSFFDSKMINYESKLLTQLKRDVDDDVVATQLKNLIKGSSPFSLLTFVAVLTQAAPAYFRDERILSAFKADALELEILIRYEVPKSYINNARPSYDATGGIRLERAGINELRSALPDAGPRPTIKLWHFGEVYAFMKIACGNLAEDLKKNCLENLQPSPPKPEAKVIFPVIPKT